MGGHLIPFPIASSTNLVQHMLLFLQRQCVQCIRCGWCCTSASCSRSHPYLLLYSKPGGKVALHAEKEVGVVVWCKTDLVLLKLKPYSIRFDSRFALLLFLINLL